MVTLLLIPDGVGVRNFVLGPFMRLAAARRPVHALHNIPHDMMPVYKNSGIGDGVNWHALVNYRDRPVPFTLRNSLTYSQTFWINNFPMKMMRRRMNRRGSWKTRAAIHVARALGYAAASPRGIQTLDWLHAMSVSRLPEVEHYRQLLAKIGPRVLFCSHQRPPDILPPVLAARSLGIPTATFIFSWDNLSSKGRIAAPFDYYLVWSDHMKSELRRYYPDISEDRVYVVGTPQFDPYADSAHDVSREDFCRPLGIDPGRPLICYSGGDAGNSPEDPQHLRTLADLIRSGAIRRQPSVVVRPAPVDDGQRYASLRRDFPELVFAQPQWRLDEPGNFGSMTPLPGDVPFLANLTRHADLNVNFASTMTLDFAIRDKPVINVAFDVTEPCHYGMPMWDYYQQWEHYEPVIALRAARFARSREEFAEHVNAYLDDPSLDTEGRQAFVQLEVGTPIGESSHRIVDVLEEIGERR